MKRKLIIFSMAATAVLGAVSCQKENSGDTMKNGNTISFSSFRKQLFTRADVDLFSFAEGTNYTLFAVQSKTTESDYGWVSEGPFDVQPTIGTEASNGTISYSPIAIFPSGEELDFYALTYGKSDEIAEIDAPVADGTTPAITIQETDGRLKDLMHSNEVKNRKPSDGTTTLPFEHALAALNFVVAKQDESNDSVEERQLEHTIITEIRLDNVAGKATMNLVTGQWTWTASDIVSRSIYSNDSGTALTISPIEMGEKDILAFPNDDGDDTNNLYDENNPYKYRKPSDDASANKGEQVIVTIKLEGLEEYDGTQYVPLTKTLVDGTEVVDGKCEVSYPVRVYDENTGEDLGPLHFLRNHKYTLSIFVMRDNVRIVAVSPQVYEWQDKNVGADIQNVYVGQPVVIGGLVWMDRNLGASSADCQNDWWHSCGYFYQYARNIPYMINLEEILDSDGKSERPGRVKKPEVGSNSAQIAVHEFHVDGTNPWHGTSYSDSQHFYMFYTLNEKGQRVYDWYGGTNYIYELDPEARTLSNRTYVAIRPGEKGYYGMMMGGQNTQGWQRTADGGWDSTNGSFWLDPADHKKGNPENQPVPKGWRMPTRADGYKILPEPAQSERSWMSYAAYLFQGRISDLDQNINVATDKLSYVLGDDNYRFQYVRGRIHVRKDVTPDANGLTPIGISTSPHDTDADAPCIYGIKYQGTSKAYRIMIKRIQSNIDGRYYLRITQYPSNKNEIFKTNLDPTGLQNSKQLSYQGTSVTKWNLQEFDWDHPSAVLDFPLQGYIDAGGEVPFWNQPGVGTIMRLPEYEKGVSASNGTNWTFYMRNNTSGVAVGNSSRRALGDCIRLVREIN